MLSIPHHLIHHPHAGLNLLVDLSAPLFTLIGKTNQIKTYSQLTQWHKEVKQALRHTKENLHAHYNAEHCTIWLFMMCATIDDLILRSQWERQWHRLNLLAAFHQEAQHPFTFFTILERISQDPAHYIDLMECMYICLSLGYKGPYHQMAEGTIQLTFISHRLYRHIRIQRGHISHVLSHAPSAMTKSSLHLFTTHHPPIKCIFVVTACLIMTIFLGLSYLMDTMTNESATYLSAIKNQNTRHAHLS